MQRTIKVGTRGSALATTQTGWVVAQLHALYPDLKIETQIIKTLADGVQNVPLYGFRERGVFVKEIENALLQGDIDLAVHSMKDLPSDLPEGLIIGAVPEREDPHDALVTREPLGEAPSEGLPLRHGAVLGSSSLRRRAQLLHHRPDLQIVDLRGNVDTRLRRLESGELDAILLAAAGLARLGLSQRVTMLLPDAVCLPAVCQGALAIECRHDDTQVRQLLAGMDDTKTHLCVRAERALLAALEGGCAVPVGALARLEGDALSLQGMIAAPDGSVLLRETRTGSPADPETIGRELGEALLAAGGREILAALAESRGA